MRCKTWILVAPLILAGCGQPTDEAASVDQSPAVVGSDMTVFEEESTEAEYAEDEGDTEIADPNIYLECTAQRNNATMNYKFSPKEDGTYSVSTYVESSNIYDEDAIYTGSGWMAVGRGLIKLKELYAVVESDYIYIDIDNVLSPSLAINRKTGVVSTYRDRNEFLGVFGSCSVSENLVKETNKF